MDTGSEAIPDQALVSHRRRTTGTCEVCGAAFETYANGHVRRFRSDAHCERHRQRDR